MSTEPNNGGPVRRQWRRPFLELLGVGALVAAAATVSIGVGLAALGLVSLWLAWSA